MRFGSVILLILLNTGCMKVAGNPGGRPTVGVAPGGRAEMGTEQGNGSDNVPPDFGTAWFLGNRTIKYCYVVNPNFGVSSSQIDVDLRAAFQLWKEYIQEKQINKQIVSSFLNPALGACESDKCSQIQESFAPGLSLAIASKLISTCTGEEDVKFYFGEEDSQINLFKKTLINPDSFSVRTSYDKIEGWGKGIAWISLNGGVSRNEGFEVPNWSLPLRLRGALAHEIGHMYGNEDLEGTIMQALPASYFQPIEAHSDKLENEIQFNLTHVDGKLELVSTPLNQDNLKLQGFDQECENCSLEAQKRIFKLFVGRSPIGPVTMQLTPKEVVFADNFGKTSLPLVMDPAPVYKTHVKRVFKTYRQSNNSSGGSLLFNESENYSGLVTTADGHSLNVTALKNAGNKLQISYLVNGRSQNLFFPMDSDLQEEIEKSGISIGSYLNQTSASNVIQNIGGSAPTFYYSNISARLDTSHQFYVGAGGGECSRTLNPRCIDNDVSPGFFLQASDTKPTSGTPQFYLIYAPTSPPVGDERAINSLGTILGNWAYGSANSIVQSPATNWKTICTAVNGSNSSAGLDNNCQQTGGNFDPVSVQLFLIADANGNGVLDPGESILPFTLVFQSTIPVHSSSANADGFYQFQVFPEDGGCTLVNTLADTSFSSISENGGTGAQFARFYYVTGPDAYTLYDPSIFKKINPTVNPELSYFDLTVDANGNLQPTPSFELTNGTSYYFRSAIVDNAGNIGYLTPDSDDEPPLRTIQGVPPIVAAHVCKPGLRQTDQ